MSNRWDNENEFYHSGEKLRERRGIFEHNIWKTIALVSIALMVVLISLVAFLTVKVLTISSPIPAITQQNSKSAQPTPIITPTQVLSMPSPTAIPPTPSPTPVPALPCIVNVGTWTGGSSDWKTLNGMLLNDGSRGMGTGQTGPTIVAPCQLNGTTNYAVETKIQVVSTSNQPGSCFGITVRGDSTGNGWQGYQGDVDIDCSSDSGSARILGAQFPNDFSLNHTPFNPGNAWHTYRVEVRGTSIKFIIDNTLSFSVNDNKYLTGEQVGLWSYATELNVSSFKVVSL